MDNAISESFVCTLKSQLVSRVKLYPEDGKNGDLLVPEGFL